MINKQSILEQIDSAQSVAVLVTFSGAVETGDRAGAYVEVTKKAARRALDLAGDISAPDWSVEISDNCLYLGIPA
jgi:hypothetical protein